VFARRIDLAQARALAKKCDEATALPFYLPEGEPFTNHYGPGQKREGEQYKENYQGEGTHS
jgi:hypothetical protein